MGKASGGPRARRDAPLLATRGGRGSALGRKYDLLGYQLLVPVSKGRSTRRVLGKFHTSSISRSYVRRCMFLVPGMKGVVTRVLSTPTLHAHA